MTAPALSSIACSETVVSALFNAAPVSSTGQPGLGWTVQVNGVGRSVSSASIGSSTVHLTVTGVIQTGDLVTAAYNDTVGDLADLATGLDPVVTFTATAATNNSLHAALLSCTTNLVSTESAVVSLVWNKPITSAAYATGLTFKINDVSAPYTSVAPGPDPRILRVTFPGDFQFDAAITFSYSPGDWASGYAIVAIADHAVINGSKVGDPTSDYPLSSVIKYLPVIHNGTVAATVGLDLNLVDQKLLNEYGPAVVDFGGQFGVVFVAQRLLPLSTGMQVTQNFFVSGHVDQASTAATDWLDTVTSRIGTAIATLRTTDQSVVLSQQQIVQV